MQDHYTGEEGKKYYQVRSKRRHPRAQAEAARVFSPYIPEDSTVLDFGCGTGSILNNIRCARRIGIEINEPSISVALKSGIEVLRNVAEVPDRIVDVVITHHALEHVQEPFKVLVQLSSKLKEGGRIVVVVPAEEPRRRHNRTWRQNDDRHLYSWTPLTMGNLLEAAGYKVTDAFVLSAGYSHYIEWSRPLPFLFQFLKKVVALVGSRYATVCVASTPAPKLASAPGEAK